MRTFWLDGHAFSSSCSMPSICEVRGQVDPRTRHGPAARVDDPASHRRRRLEPEIERRVGCAEANGVAHGRAVSFGLDPHAVGAVGAVALDRRRSRRGTSSCMLPFNEQPSRTRTSTTGIAVTFSIGRPVVASVTFPEIRKTSTAA